jgi:hypothetical protein
MPAGRRRRGCRRPAHGQYILPASFSEAYLHPKVLLEIGPLASWVPSARHTIQPYAAEVFPKVFIEPACQVVAISAERTFWEKATILHQQAHRTGAMPSRYSRHYYDFYKLASSPVRQRNRRSETPSRCGRI